MQRRKLRINFNLDWTLESVRQDRVHRRTPFSFSIFGIKGGTLHFKLSLMKGEIAIFVQYRKRILMARGGANDSCPFRVFLVARGRA